MKRESLLSKQKRCQTIYSILKEKNPNLKTFLTHKNNFELLIAVILSAQCTDERVNLTTPKLFQSFPTPEKMSKAPLKELEELLQSVNYFRTKAKNIRETARLLVDTYSSNVPNTLTELIVLPGVGRKTANVVLGQAFNLPGITVDTHIKRVNRRLGFTIETDPVKIEMTLHKIWPKEYWTELSTLLIVHGRQVCKAHKALCQSCLIAHYCPKILS